VITRRHPPAPHDGDDCLACQEEDQAALTAYVAIDREPRKRLTRALLLAIADEVRKLLAYRRRHRKRPKKETP
jgi:hypothetical protein